jgi:hypothetical protein
MMTACHPTAHDFHHSATCHECGLPREDRIPETVPDKRPKFAGAYLVGIAYGGPEEGGWYETVNEPLASILVRHDDDALRVARELWNAFSDRDDGRDISSVLATGAVCIYWEETPGEHATRSVGRYS